MAATLTVERIFQNQAGPGGSSQCKGLLVIALTALLFAGCGWDNTWIIGDWVQSYSYAPYTDFLRFEAGGKRYLYDYYDAENPVSTKTWSLNGDVLTVDGVVYVIMKIGDDQYTQEGFTYYRKGTEPGGNIFDHTATVLSVDEWWEDTILLQTLKLFSFTASGAGEYEVYWDDDFKGSSSTTSDIVVSAYREDRSTELFPPKDSGHFVPAPVALSSREIIYIIVDAYWQAGSFRIKVVKSSQD